MCPFRVNATVPVARDIEVAPLTRHSVLALCPVRVGTVAMPKVNVLIDTGGEIRFEGLASEIREAISR